MLCGVWFCFLSDAVLKFDFLAVFLARLSRLTSTLGGSTTLIRRDSARFKTCGRKPQSRSRFFVSRVLD